MHPPFAEYTLTAKPDWLQMSLRVGDAMALDPKRGLTVARKRDAEIYVEGDARLFALGWGGTRNHLISWDGDGWAVHHLGHHAPLWINDTPRHDRSHRLSPGDRVAPALGLVFTFTLRPELEPLAQELARLNWAPMSDERVLCDWVMERTGMDSDAASLACRHLTTRNAVDRTG